MTQLINQSELLKRALTYVNETRNEHPERPLTDILDQAGMQFNLTPLDYAALQRLFCSDEPSQD